jgi:flavorubredoxin
MRTITPGVSSVGALDWNRRNFDSVMQTPEGVTYNSYLVKGTTHTALLDTVEPRFVEGLMGELLELETLDYIVIHHTEQDHSSALPVLVKKYPSAKIVCVSKAQTLLQYWFDLPAERFMIVKEGDSLDLGGKSLTFSLMPWIHWPDTMVTYLKEDRILFTCDLFGAHIAQSALFAGDDGRVIEAAKEYYGAIMAPYRGFIAKYLDRIDALEIDLIAPSHGPLHNKPAKIIAAYREWTADAAKKLVLIPFITMHDSTRLMVEMLAEELIKRDVEVLPVDLSAPDLNRLVVGFVDAGAIVWASPVFLTGAHPNVLYAAHFANYLKPKAKVMAVIGSMGWGSKMTDQLTGVMGDLKSEFLEPVLCKGVPREKDREALAGLAENLRLKI